MIKYSFFANRSCRKRKCCEKKVSQSGGVSKPVDIGTPTSCVPRSETCDNHDNNVNDDGNDNASDFRLGRQLLQSFYAVYDQYRYTEVSMHSTLLWVPFFYCCVENDLLIMHNVLLPPLSLNLMSASLMIVNTPQILLSFSFHRSRQLQIIAAPSRSHPIPLLRLQGLSPPAIELSPSLPLPSSPTLHDKPEESFGPTIEFPRKDQNEKQVDNKKK